MKRNSTLTALIAAAVLGTATLGVQAGERENAAFAQSKITAAQAVDKAVAKIGGQAVEVNFDLKRGRSIYKVEVQNGGKEYDVYVDAASGEVVDSREDYKNNPNKTRPAVRTTLKQAIAAAEAKTGGRAKEADLKYKSGTPVYKVETVSGTQKHKVRVDAQSGQVLSAHIDY